jgi:hypothetical protein
MSPDAFADTAPVSPWHRLGLRHNPFGEPPPDEIAALMVLPQAPAWEARLRRPRQVLQFLGDAGRGKTARLRALEARFPAAPYVYLADDEPLPKLPPIRTVPDSGPALLLDEAQRLPRRRRRRLFRQAARRGAALVLASHEDLTEEMQRAGLEVRTEVVAGLDIETLLVIVKRRLAWAEGAQAPSAPRHPESRLSRDDARRLVDRFGDDLRSLLDHLYEDYQRRLTNHSGETDSWRNVS